MLVKIAYIITWWVILVPRKTFLFFLLAIIITLLQEKVHKILWVVNECVERVPDALEDTKELLKFGLNKTDLKGSHNELNIDTNQLVALRIQLLKFLDSLTIYEVN